MKNEKSFQRRGIVLFAALAASVASTATPAAQQHSTTPVQGRAPAHVAPSHVIVPQARGWALEHGRDPIQVERVQARVEIVEQVATTTLDIAVRNPSNRQAEAILLLPVPSEAAVRSFLFDGAALEPTARLLPRDEARRTYDSIVAQIKDPALLEFAGFNLIRSSVFPVPAGGNQRIQLTYEHVLERDGARVDYALPKSESLAVQVPWTIQVEVRAKKPLSMIYSPTHELVTELKQENRAVFKVGGQQRPSAPGPFLLSYLIEEEGVSASLLAYPDPEVGGGYFLLMAGLPAKIEDAERKILREVTLVLDRSGSMAGEKMDQARAAAQQVIEGLEDGEAFNIIDYASQVNLFAPKPVVKNAQSIAQARRYLAALRPTGGTNIHDGLLEALRQERVEGTLSIVLFLTDGLPTVGNTSELAIGQMVAKGNADERRIFTFGVGHDVNVPLLDRLSDATRASSTFVLPGEDVEVKVARVFRRLYGPVLADLELETRDARGQVSTRFVRELMPGQLPDLFEGDQLVLLGQYTASEPVEFRLQGNFLGAVRNFAFRFDLNKASTKNAFVPRLWAARKIAFLVDQIRQAGARMADSPSLVGGQDLFQDPKYRELAEEILRLSTRFGVLSEYTAFLATEGTNLGNWDTLVLACNLNLDERAVKTRFGQAAVNQGRNFNEGKVQRTLKYDNSFWNAANESVSISTVQQVCDRAFFLQGDQWIDANLIEKKVGLQPDDVVDFGTPAHQAMLVKLVDEGRQGLLALPGEILMEYEGRRVLVKNTPVRND